MRVSRACLTLGLAALLGAPGIAQLPDPKPLAEEDAVFLLPTLSAVPLGDGIQVFPGPSPLVPLGELCRLLGFGIEVRARQGRAEGFFISPGRSFQLDLPSRSVRVEGRASSFQPGQVRAFGGDLYVAASLLEAWFPLTVKAEFRDSALYLGSSEVLPIQAAWDRDRQNARAIGTDAGGPPAAPRYPAPYSLASVPMADLAMNWQTSQYGASRSPAASLALGGDLFWMSSLAFLSRDSQGSFRSSRWTLFREDPGAGLLGPLRARRISLGDQTQGAALELAGALPQGRGLLLDNYPTSFRSAFAMRSFRGPLQPGWSVELYQNNGLVGFQHARPDGTYEFPTVPLRFGLNLFRLVFHGPLGERREENHRIDIDQDQPSPGEFFYRLAAVRPTRLTYPDDVVQLNPDERRPALLAEGEYGLSSYLSAKSGVMAIRSPLGGRDYGVAGFRTVLPFLSLELMGATDRVADGAASRPQGLAAGASLRTGWGYSSLMASHSEFRRGFLPTMALLSGRSDPLTLRQEDTLNLFTTVPGGPSPLNLGYQFQRQAYLEGGRVLHHRLQVSATFRQLSFTQSLGLGQDSTRGQRLRTLDGQSLLAAYLWDLSLQGSLQYQRSEGHLRMGTWTLAAQRRTEDGMLYTAGIRGGTGWLKEATYLLTAMRQTGRFSYGADLGYARTTGYTLGVRLQISVGREPRTGRWVTDAQAMAGMGAISARAFADDNYNGIKDPGERVLEGVRFRIAESEHPDRRPDPSVALYTHVGTGREVEFEVDTTTLEEASQQPAVPRYLVLPRTGRILQLDYPIVVLGEVNGTTRVRRDGQTLEQAGLEVELIPEGGGTAQVRRSAYDGYFEFRNLVPGSYRLRVSDRDRLRLQLKSATERQLRIEPRRPIHEGQDLTIQFEGPDGGASKASSDPSPPPAGGPS